MTNPANVIEVKEELSVAARALRLTLQPWEVRTGDNFERVFAALKQRSDGLYVLASGLINANQKWIVGFAQKSRLPSVYQNKENVEAGGLMSYGSDQTDRNQRVAYYVDRILAKLLIEKGLITREEFMQKISEERATYLNLITD